MIDRIGRSRTQAPRRNSQEKRGAGVAQETAVKDGLNQKLTRKAVSLGSVTIGQRRFF